MNRFRKIFSNRSKSSVDPLAVSVQNITGLKVQDVSLYHTAFTHKSTGEKTEDGIAISYERLEFLGDAILGAVIAEYIYNEVPSGDEGYLTKMRSKIVSREHLNELGEDFELIHFIKAQVPVENFGRNIHGNLFEALVGAVYLDRGYKFCKRFIENKVIEPYVDIQKLEGKIISYKSLLIEWCQKHKKQFRYHTYEDTGASELRHYAVKLYLDNKVIAKARATSKKKAEEKASKRAYFALQDKMNNRKR
ncbi:ribonuclease III [Nonlabens tegetincola]|uniref:Ribonuclease 3 n=1 Tax=Nonlabens tegetincola TaxID=323273 RepID=A0A090PY08_9FLAO|nr:MULTISPECIES: ribonuclease III [Nonlabens]MEE2801306.1 ribonuclease III [Bacteroidota bacterium]ALM20933.1 ribonuclease III [Nonlabens sp. MIC269]ARN72345.1 ribonuclease III [Nonlabens tegetincola]PQJ20038.1 ribonuclease III [Nonlabens tegetincola]GAK95739.1 ribonuclease III [Nonlabens tegetincola]